MTLEPSRRQEFEARLIRARQGRALLVDPLGVAHVERLAAAAAGGPTSARERLFDAAERALARVEERTETADVRARKRIEETSLRGRDTSALRASFAEGDLAAMYRRASRDGLRPDVGAAAPARDVQRALGRARIAGVEPEDHGGSAFETLSAAYAAGASQLGAALTRDRVTRSAPVEAGRYHTHAVVRELVETLDALSPTYLAGLVARLDALGALDAFAATFEPEPVVVPLHAAKARRPEPQAPRGKTGARGGSTRSKRAPRRPTRR